MLSNSSFARLTLGGSLALSIFAGLTLGLASARAQEGVAGAAPTLSKPKKPATPEPTREAAPRAAKEKQQGQIRVVSNLVTTPVTVMDSSGGFIYDLQEEDFQLLDNGVPQRLEHFEVEMNPLAVVIVVQTNQAVAPVLDQVRPLAPGFSSLMLGPQGQAAVITYGDEIRVAQAFSDDGDLLGQTLKELKAQGDNARLNDALLRAIALLEKRPTGQRRVIVGFSDGFDRGSETRKEEVVRRATGAEVTIYGLGFNPMHLLLAKKPEAPPPNPLDTNVTRPLPPGTVPTPTREENVYGTPIPVVEILGASGEMIRSTVASSLLEFYAGYTGGVFYSHWKQKALEEQLSRVASEIHSRYDLAYVPSTLDQAGFHRILVQVRRPGVKVRARAGYFYPFLTTQEETRK